ncbi:aldehyde dehydrogenase [Anaeramoeba ignava]|uniref:NADP-dependent glyceraldehyde-3-phosphate dehydrogenase n=1 Tax=Anaeramoeba ignava TaxID=1746090 RepID=A0A9Q0LLW7_ANAIG|nr:aldehyde dehydrogenase [Anaeramoeba ignava]|eukprot:Anaeramoba_ignava/a219691_72.p1 GENE.a219691_72~~a219691_72.p1  ORF type:complete len:501 (-),score=162.01 a219691_72:71-1573(-)
MDLIRKQTIKKEVYPLYIAGKQVMTNKFLDVFDKFTEKKIARVSLAEKKEIQEAITTVSKSRKAMNDLPIHARKDILRDIAKQFRERKDELASLITMESGKPIKISQVEMNRAIDTVENCSEEAGRNYGEYQDFGYTKSSQGYQGTTRRFPIGPIAMFSPFNFPINLIVHKIAPAIATGNPFIIKPSPRTPISAIVLGDILANTALPKNSFSVLPMENNLAMELLKDDRMKMVSFTGSDVVGWKIKSLSGKKKVTLELGGDAACVVDKCNCAETDLDTIAKRIIFGAFYQAGQSCISVQRVYLHDTVYNKLKERLIHFTKLLKTVDPMLPDENPLEWNVGPLISTDEAKRVESWVENAKEKKAKVLVGGQRINNFYLPTILEKIHQNSIIAQNEVFGPVFYIEKFSNMKGVITKINKSRYGLQAGLYTNNLKRAFSFYENVECGGVVINDIPSARVDAQVYGGIKDSGMGSEGIRAAMHEMTVPKIMLMKDYGIPKLKKH